MVRPTLRTIDASTFDPGDLASAKGATMVSVCLPAKDEEPTVGAIVAAIRTDLVDRAGLVDEIVVLDDGSRDGTARAARAAGARVVDVADVLPGAGPGTGKGEALWKSLAAAGGEILVWCDADLTSFSSRFVTGLLGPLLTDPSVHFTKGFYERPGEDGPGTGGRTTELMARPLIATLFPELSDVVQPLSGEYAGRRALLERLAFVQGYGVDLALLIDVVRSVGRGGIVQVDLGERVHRNRPLDQLGPQAVAVLQAALARAEITAPGARQAVLQPPGAPSRVVEHVERPPMVTVPAYRVGRRQPA